MLVVQISTRQEAMAALGGGAEGIVLMGADSIGLLDDLHLAGAKAWLHAGVLPGAGDAGSCVAQVGRCGHHDYATAVADGARAGADGLVVDDWCTLAAALPIAHAAGMPLVAGGALAASSGARVRFYEELGLAGTFVSPQLSVGQVVRVASGSALELWAYIHGRLDLLGEAATLAGAWNDGLQRGKWAVNGEGDAAHLLNLRTLAAIKPLRQLATAGMAGFVVRAAGMGPQWTERVCRVYRRELDRIAGAVGQPGVTEQFDELGTTSNTGLGPGFYMGDQAGDYINRRHGGDEGTAVGAVESVRRSDGRVQIGFSREVPGTARLEARPAKGGVEAAVRLSMSERHAAGAWAPGQRGWANAGGRVKPGYVVYMLPQQHGGSAGETWAQGLRRLEVEALAFARLGAPLAVTYRMAGTEVTRHGIEPVPCTGERCLSAEWLSMELARVGGRPISVTVVECDVQQGVTVPPSEVNAVRRAALNGLIDAVLAPGRRELVQEDAFPGTLPPAFGEASPRGADTTGIMAMVRHDVDPQLLAAAGAQGVCLDCDTSYAAMADYFARARRAGLLCAYDSVEEVLDDDVDYATSQMAKACDAGAELLVVEDLALLSAALGLAPTGVVAGPGCRIRDACAARWVSQLGARGYVVPPACPAGVPSMPCVTLAPHPAGGEGIMRGIVAGGRLHLGLTRYCVLGAELGSASRQRRGGLGRGDCTAPCRGGDASFRLTGAGGYELYLTFDRSCRAHLYAPEPGETRADGAAMAGIEHYRAMGYDWAWLDLRAYSGEGAVGACARFAATEA